MKKTILIFSLLSTFTLQIQTMERDNSERISVLCLEITTILLQQPLLESEIFDNSSFEEKRQRAGTVTPSSLFNTPTEISSRSSTPSLFHSSKNIPSPRNLGRVNHQATHTMNNPPSTHRNLHQIAAFYCDFPGAAYHSLN